MFDDCGEDFVVLVGAEDLGKSGEDDLEDLDVSEEGGLDWGVGFCEEEDGDKTLEGMRSVSSLACQETSQVVSSQEVRRSDNCLLQELGRQR